MQTSQVLSDCSQADVEVIYLQALQMSISRAYQEYIAPADSFCDAALSVTSNILLACTCEPIRCTLHQQD